MKTICLSVFFFHFISGVAQLRVPENELIADYNYYEPYSETKYLNKDSSLFTGIMFSNYKNGNIRSEDECIDGIVIKGKYWDKKGKLRSYFCSACSDTTFIDNTYRRNFLEKQEIWILTANTPDGIHVYKDFYNKGKIKSELIYGYLEILSDKRWYPNGHIRKSFTKNQIDSNNYEREYQLWYKNGNLMETFFCKNNLPHGKWLIYHQNGQIANEMNYENGRRVGWQRSYSKSGKIEQEVELIDGNGILISRDEKNKSIGIQNFVNGYPDGIQLTWDGKDKQLLHEVLYINGQKNGAERNWNEDGKLESERNYINDTLHGGVKEFYENGKPQLEANYLNGELDGTKKEWYPSGKLEKEAHYKEGKLDGIYKEWFENGQLKISCSYKEGKEHGTRMEWDENGIFSRVENFTNGVQDGFEKTFYNNGHPMYYRSFKNGLRDGKWIGYYGYKKNKIECEFTYVNDTIQGTYKKWYDNGQLKYEMTYVDGVENGPFLLWYENGQQKVIGNYVNGELIFDKCWDKKGNEIDCSNTYIFW